MVVNHGLYEARMYLMRSVSVATLKNNLSRYLAAVRGGEEIVITSLRHPVARIVPAEKPLMDDLKIITA